MSVDTKIEYRDFCSHQSDLPVFYQPWYLDVVSGDHDWSVSIAKHGDKVVGVWPHLLKQKYGIKYITIPPLCPYLGPWIAIPPNIEKKVSINAFRKKILKRLHLGLPKSSLVATLSHPKFQNWLPLSWSGYRVESRYSFIIDLALSSEELWSSIDSKQRNIIRKAQSTYKVNQVDDIAESLEFILTSMRLVGVTNLEASVIGRTVTNADIELKQRCARTVYQARNKEGNLCGAIYIVSDNGSDYLLLTGQAKEVDKRASGAVALLIWHAISKNAGAPRVFDFEGGNMASIGDFFMSFGGYPRSYARIWKAKSKVHEVLFRILNKI